jgi:hypothetical protein
MENDNILAVNFPNFITVCIMYAGIVVLMALGRKAYAGNSGG